jgi:hypothetical protein
MTVKSLASDDRRSIRTKFQGRLTRRDGFDALVKSDIAQLSATAINKMTCDELVRMIRVAKLPAVLCPNLDEHLPFYDRSVPMRLAHLAQRCCRVHATGRL